MSAATIGGIAAGVIVGILLILFGAFVWRRRLRKRAGAPGSGGETKPSKSVHPYVNFDYGTGPVTPHTPSLPLISGPTPPASPMVSISPSNSEVSLHGDFTPPSVNSRTRLVLHTGADQSSAPASEAWPSEPDHGEREAKRESSPPSYPPTMTSGEGSSRRNSGQVGCNSPHNRAPHTNSKWPVFLFQQNFRPLPNPRLTPSDNHQFYTSPPPGNDFQNTRVWGDQVHDFGTALTLATFSDQNSGLSDPEELLPPYYDLTTEPFPHPMSVPVPVPPPLVSPPLPTPLSLRSTKRR